MNVTTGPGTSSGSGHLVLRSADAVGEGESGALDLVTGTTLAGDAGRVQAALRFCQAEYDSVNVILYHFTGLYIYGRVLQKMGAVVRAVCLLELPALQTRPAECRLMRVAQNAMRAGLFVLLPGEALIEIVAVSQWQQQCLALTLGRVVR